MEDVIEQLQQVAETVPVPLELPTEDDLLDVEEALLLQLPKDYRAFLLSVSDLVIGSLEPATAADPQSHTYLPELAAAAWDGGLPRYLIPICVTGPLVYAIDPDGQVSAWQGATQRSGVWETVWEWAAAKWRP